jgi:hypothetical protein
MNNQIDGIYAAYLAGAMANGFGLLLFRNGRIAGADASGVIFDGSYIEDNGSSLSIALNVKSPPNIPLIQGGISGPQGDIYELKIHLPLNFAEKDFTRVETPRGPVNARLTKLRSLDE